MFKFRNQQVMTRKMIYNGRVTYRSRDEIPEKRFHALQIVDDTTDATVSLGVNPIAIIPECEIQKCEVHEDQVPKELGSNPLKSHHRIDQYAVYQSLDQDVRKFNCNLQKHKAALLASDFRGQSNLTMLLLIYEQQISSMCTYAVLIGPNSELDSVHYLQSYILDGILHLGHQHIDLLDQVLHLHLL